MTRQWVTLITCSLNEAQDGLFAAVVSVYSSKLSCSHLFSWGNVGGWTAEVWFHLVRVLAKCAQDMKQTDRLCMIDFVDLSRAVPSPRCTTVNCYCTLVICRHLCCRGHFNAENPVIYIYKIYHRFLWLNASGCFKMHLEINSIYTVSNSLTLTTNTIKTFKPSFFVSNNNFFFWHGPIYLISFCKSN